MGKGMTNRRIKRTMALLLTVTMLPFADYAQAFAYSGQRTSAGLDLQQTAVSSNAVKQNGEDSLDSLNESNKETLDASGNNIVANEPWVRITPEEVEAIKLAEITQYDDMTVEEDAYVLEEDMEVGNLHINGESLDLNGHTLIVYGTLLQSAGEISLNGGKLVVGQDYRIQTREENSEWNQENELYLYKAGSGKLVMTNANDYLVVCGSFVTESNVSHEGSLTAGIMEVMGDFIQLCSENEANFVATENHKIVFNSAEGQTVFMNSTGVDKSRFANMELGFVSEEGSGTNGEKPEILFGGNPYVSGQVNDTKSHKVSGKIGVGSATTLVEGYFGGGASILQEIQVPENETITFGGDMDILAKVSVYGILNAEGNVTVTETGISMEGGRLWVGKNFTVTSENYSNPSWGMKMSHEEDYVLVEGDFCYHMAGWKLSAMIEMETLFLLQTRQTLHPDTVMMTNIISQRQ